MKRILSLALATVMCLALVLALGSCSFLGKYIPFLNKDEKNEETVYTVTQEEWDAALAEINYTVEGNSEVIMDSKVTVDGVEQQHDAMQNSSSIIQKSTADANYYWSKNLADSDTEQEHEYTEYMVLVDGKWYELTEYDETWTATEYYTDYEVETISSHILIEEFDYGFSDFTYNEEKKAYELNKKPETSMMFPEAVEEMGAEFDSSLSITLWFEDGNLIKVEISYEEFIKATNEGQTAIVEISMSASFVISNHGTTVVDLPEYEIND